VWSFAGYGLLVVYCLSVGFLELDVLGVGVFDLKILWL
jgi:hypothetical protein